MESNKLELYGLIEYVHHLHCGGGGVISVIGYVIHYLLCGDGE